MTSEQRFGLLLLAMCLSAIIAKDWRLLLAPVTIPLMFVYLLWWANRPLESSRGHGHERFRRGEEA